MVKKEKAGILNIIAGWVFLLAAGIFGCISLVSLFAIIYAAYAKGWHSASVGVVPCLLFAAGCGVFIDWGKKSLSSPITDEEAGRTA
jgi:hypothetical protein